MNIASKALPIAVILAATLLAKDSCVECHSSLEGRLQAPATAYEKDVHRHRGFSCAGCHGGDPTVDDPEAAMSRARGFRGKILRTAVPKLCASCHGDAGLMHKYSPRQRVDQYAQYLTSVHGKRLAAGDAAAANCVDCHGVHNIREVKDALSPVHPLRLPETCAHCHSDASRMAKYKIPTNQFDDYRKSVHWVALAKRGDLSAPSCASCHGNHGATPPQVSSVAAVCGTCHVMMEDLFNKSPHQPVFASMGAAGCVVCHGNHAISDPSVKMLGGPGTVCGQCHEANSAGAKAGAEMARLLDQLDRTLSRSDSILQQAARAGMEVSGAMLKQQEAMEGLVKARVAVHAFRVEAVSKPVQQGLRIAAETRRAGEEALKEKDRRRIGLAISLVTIVVTMAGLWLAIRTIERPSHSGVR